MNPLTITTRDTLTGPVLEISGDLDYASAARLRDLIPAIALRPGQRLVLDLGGMDFCDSSGVSALIVARNHAHAAEAEAALAAVPANTMRTLRIVGLDQIFSLYPDSETATRP
ncbi:STAS domain-containing protein [Streptomyces sp. Edi4]|uniref:STAS domain-containing protein n=1 Tax=Streptomyces sp. Edi4 TaxID=3162527 RepID=UPI003305E456